MHRVVQDMFKNLIVKNTGLGALVEEIRK